MRIRISLLLTMTICVYITVPNAGDVHTNCHFEQQRSPDPHETFKMGFRWSKESPFGNRKCAGAHSNILKNHLCRSNAYLEFNKSSNRKICTIENQMKISHPIHNWVHWNMFFQSHFCINYYIVEKNLRTDQQKTTGNGQNCKIEN